MRNLPLSTRLLVAAALAGAGSLHAQDLVHIPGADPAGNPVNMIPFGSHETAGTYRTQRYQTLLPATKLGTVARTIRAVAFAPQSDGRHVFDRIVVRMTQIRIPALTTDFAVNLGSQAVTVLEARDYHWHHDQGSWSSIGLQRVFRFQPNAGDLLIDIEVRNAHSRGGLPEAGFHRADDLPRVYGLADENGKLPATGVLSTGGLFVRIAFDLASAGAFGDGCTGSNQKKPVHGYRGTPKLGNTVHAELRDVLDAAPALMILGATVDTRLFPMPLTGAGTCMLYTLPLTMTPVLASQSTASVPLGIPRDPSLRGVQFYTQFLALDLMANDAGITSSNYVRLLVGS